MLVNRAIILSEIVELRRDDLVSKKYTKSFFDNISLAESYSIQLGVINALGRKVVGWKLGGTNDKTRKMFNTSELYWGPIFEGRIVKNSEKIHLNCGEVEVALRFDKAIQCVKDAITPLEVENYFDSVALSMEYPWSTIRNVSDLGITALISDCCSSGQCFLGDNISFSKFIDYGLMKISINSQMVEEFSTDLLVDGLRETVCDFINKSTRMGFELKSGQWVFTGGLSQCRSYDAGAYIQVDSNNLNMKFRMNK